MANGGHPAKKATKKTGKTRKTAGNGKPKGTAADRKGKERAE